MKSKASIRFPKLGLISVVAISLVSMLALPALASAKAGHRHHSQRVRSHRGKDSRHRFKASGPGSLGSTDTGAPGGQENAGVIASFDGTTLTINLYDGQTLSGVVSSSTEIEGCPNEGQQGSDDEAGDSGEESGDQGQSEGPVPPQDSARQSSAQGQAGEGQDQSDDNQGQGDDAASCSIATLTPGAIVHEAELEAGPNGELFHSVDLAG